MRRHYPQRIGCGERRLEASEEQFARGHEDRARFGAGTAPRDRPITRMPPSSAAPVQLAA